MLESIRSSTFPIFSARRRLLSGLILFLWFASSLSADSVDADDTATSIDLGGFIGIADNAPVRSIFDLISVGTLISGAQSDAKVSDDRFIARDTPVPVGAEDDASDFNLRSFAYRVPLPRTFALTVQVENNEYGQRSYLYSPRFETYGLDRSRPDRTDGRMTLSYGTEKRIFAGVSYNRITSPLSRSQIGLGGVREGRGSFRQDLAGVEAGVGWFPELLGGLFQGYVKGSVGTGGGATRFRLVTLGNSRDPRTEEEKVNDNRVFLETEYLEIVAGKVQLRSLYGIAETGILYRFASRLALRVGLFLQAYTYTIPGTAGNMYFRATSGDETFTPLQLVPSNVFRNLDTIRGISFSFLVKF